MRHLQTHQGMMLFEESSELGHDNMMNNVAALLIVTLRCHW